MGAILSIMMLLALALLGGAFVLWRRGGYGKQALLMLVLATVIAVNIGIWTLPDAGGEAPVARLPD